VLRNRSHNNPPIPVAENEGSVHDSRLLLLLLAIAILHGLELSIEDGKLVGSNGDGARQDSLLLVEDGGGLSHGLAALVSGAVAKLVLLAILNGEASVGIEGSSTSGLVAENSNSDAGGSSQQVPPADLLLRDHAGRENAIESRGLEALSGGSQQAKGKNRARIHSCCPGLIRWLENKSLVRQENLI
jgi:hypothetical protein